MAHAVKYHPAEWHASNQANYLQSEKDRAASERLRAECERLRKESEDTTLHTQRNVNHKLSQRLTDINFWTEELKRKLQETMTEIDAVLSRKAILEKALRSTNFPLEVGKRCLTLREERQGIDLVHDEVEIQLLKEVETIEGVQNLLQKTLDESEEQIRLLRVCKFNLEKDLKEKSGALGIDNKCANLTDHTPGLGFAPSAIKVPADSITPQEWQSISNANIRQSEQERIASTTLRGVINSVLDQTQQDMSRQRERVDSAFYRRIQELTAAKATLEEHLHQVIKEADAQEINIRTIEGAIHAKSGPMQLAHTRLDFRSLRPNKELVRDPVQYHLVSEVAQIEGSIEQLTQRLQEAEAAFKRLNRTRLTLEEDITVKTNSIYIDQDQCMSLRKQMDPLAFI